MCQAKATASVGLGRGCCPGPRGYQAIESCRYIFLDKHGTRRFHSPRWSRVNKRFHRTYFHRRSCLPGLWRSLPDHAGPISWRSTGGLRLKDLLRPFPHRRRRPPRLFAIELIHFNRQVNPISGMVEVAQESKRAEEGRALI